MVSRRRFSADWQRYADLKVIHGHYPTFRECADQKFAGNREAAWRREHSRRHNSESGQSSSRARPTHQSGKDDSHLWAEKYDRKLTDVFGVESEIAKAIADQLRAKLTGQEEEVIAARPTDSPEAYDAYLRGLAYTLKTGNSPANTLGAQKYLRDAVRLDPKFALSWALLSYVDALGYLTLTLQPTVALREETGQAAETALSLQPNLGEAVMARGYYYYACLKDYDAAVRYFEQARQFLPNSSQIPESLAYVARRRGQWDRSESVLQRSRAARPAQCFPPHPTRPILHDRSSFPGSPAKV